MLPVFMSVFHCVDQLGPGATRSLSSSPCQYDATFWVAASSMLTDQVLPLALHQLPPAC
jgi:hypothetical protein